MMVLLFPDVYASGVSRSVRHEAHLSLIMVDLAEAVEARAATDGPVSLVDAAVGRLSPVSVARETAGVAGTMIVNHSAKVT